MHSVLTPLGPVGTGHNEPVDSGSHQCPCHLHGHPVCGGRVSLPGAGGEDHSERSVGHLEERSQGLEQAVEAGIPEPTKAGEWGQEPQEEVGQCD